MLIKNKVKPKFYSSHRARNGKEKNLFLQEELFSKAKEALRANKKVSLEIGFGDGKSVIDMATKKYEDYFFCVESYHKGVEILIRETKQRNLNNIFMLYGDAIDVIERLFDNKTINNIFIFFPDPWPKKRHKKRRVLNEYSMNLLFNKLRDDGVFHFATDNISYAYETRSLFSNYFSGNRKINFSAHRGDRPITKYEKKALVKKNIIYDIIVKS